MRRTSLFPFFALVWAVLASVAIFTFPCSVSAIGDPGIAPPESSEVPRDTRIFPPSSWTQEKTYADKISHKLGFGFLNITAGWLALFYEPAHAENFFQGCGEGILYAVTNTAGGLLHAATFPIPVDLPLPHGGISYEYDR